MTTATLPASAQRRTKAPDARTDYETPPAIFAALHAEFCFTLDAAACPHNAKCERYFTEADDGLAQPWSGVVWCNPPYGRGIGQWVAKAAAEAGRGVTSVLLLPASCETAWWQDYIWDADAHQPREGVEVRFPRGRINFWLDGKPTSGSTLTSAVVVFRPTCAISQTDDTGCIPTLSGQAVGPVTTAYVGRNSPLFAAHLGLYVAPGSTVVDLCHGRGIFWRGGLGERYRLVAVDNTVNEHIHPTLQADFRHLPIAAACADAVVLDPPYANNGGAHPASTGVHTTYNLQPGLSTGAIHALYREGITEAARILRPGGHLLVKSQDGIESGRRHWTTDLIREWAECAGFEAIDQGVLVNPHPPRMRHKHQQHARSNHSFLTTFKYHGQGRFQP